MTENLDQLRQVAENAAPGPWRKDDRDQVVRRADHLIVYDASCDRMEEWAADTDAQFIATFDPPTVLALIDRVEAAEVSVSNQRSAVKALAERNVELTKFKDAYSLQAQELEQAEAERDFRQKENKELFEQIERVREVAHYSNKVHREAILEALDGGEQK